MKNIDQATEKFVLMVGDSGTIISYFKANKLIDRTFAESPISREITDLLRKYPKVPYYIVLDTVGQNFFKKTFPPVSYSNALILAKKQLNNLVGSAEIKEIVNYGKSSENAKDWSFLLVGVEKLPKFDEWINFLSSMPNKFSGIYLMPLEGAGLFKELEKSNPKQLETGWKIYVTNSKVAGIRIIAINNQTMVFSRIVKISYASGPEAIAGNIEQEIANTIEYLRRFDFGDKDYSSVVIITSGKVKDSINQANIKNISDIKIFTPYEVVQNLNLGNVANATDNYSDIVFSYYIASLKKKTLKIAPKIFVKIQALATSNLAIKVISVILAIYLLQKTVFLGLDVKNITNNINAAIGKQLEVQRRYEDAKVNFSKYPVEFRESVTNFIEIHTNLVKDNIIIYQIITNFLKSDLNQHYIKSLKYTKEDDKNTLGEFEVSLYTENLANNIELLEFLKKYISEITALFPEYKLESEDPATKIVFSENVLDVDAQKIPETTNLKFKFFKK
jgi:hypothetical protein